MPETKADHSGHRERMKQRFIKEGIDGFDDHQILEMLLFYSVPRRDTNELAHELIEKFGSLRNIFEAPYSSLAAAGIPESTAVLLSLIPGISRRYSERTLEAAPVLSSVESAARFFVSKFVGYTSEHFMIVCLDNKGTLKKFADLGAGDLNSVDTNVRALVTEVINSGSTGVIIAHNHPNGLPEPSPNDFEATRQIASVLKTMRVRLYDHVIVSGSDYRLMSAYPGTEDLFY